MEPPNPPWYRRSSAIVAGVIGVAVIAALVGWRGLSRADTPEPTVTSQTLVTTTVTTSTTTPPTSLRQNTTTRPTGALWSETGRDVGRSPGFRASGGWRIEWSFDCSNYRRYGGGNFKITGGGAFERVEIQRFAVEDRGTRRVSNGGFGHLQVDSVCKRWTVTVMDD
jgi:hypothetical protein